MLSDITNHEKNFNNEQDYEESDSQTLIEKLSFCVLDLETTGGNHSYDKIIEIGLVRIEKLKITEKLDLLINPEIPIPDFIQKLTSIPKNSLTNAPTIEDAIDQILKFIGDSILVAHNSSFDIPFLNSVLKRLNRQTLRNKTLCTNLMTKNLIPEIVSSNLSYMSKIFHIPHNRAHRALEDALATAHLLINYLNFFIEKKINKINQLYYPQKRFELDQLHLHPNEWNDEVLNKIIQTRTSLTITLKGEKGIILNIIPLDEKKDITDIKFVKNCISQIDWNRLTIKIHGPFIQSLIHLFYQFSKIPKDNQNHILKYLSTKYLSSSNNLEKDYMDYGYKLHQQEQLFLITRHLIPEQFSLYKFPFQNNKKDLVFRYPGHLQKLKHHIEKGIRKNEVKNQKQALFKDESQSELKKSILPQSHMMYFIYIYLKNLNNSESCSHLLFSFSEYKNPNFNLKSLLDQYNSQVKNNYDYPKEHI